MTCNVLFKFSSCSSADLLNTMMSSIIALQPSSFFSISVIRHWKISRTLIISNGSHLKRNRPTGVINMVNLAISGSRGYLAESACCIKLGKVLSTSELWGNIFQGRKYESCTPHSTIQLSQIDTDPELPITFLYWYHGCTPYCWPGDSFNDAGFFHPLKLFFYFWHERKGNSPCCDDAVEFSVLIQLNLYWVTLTQT